MLFGSDGVVKLADFGLGKLLDRNQILTRSLVGVSLGDIWLGQNLGQNLGKPLAVFSNIDLRSR